MKKQTTLKALVLSLAMAVGMLLPMTTNAQSDGFFRGGYDSYNSRDEININSNTGGGIQNDDFGAPLGSGLLILTAAGAGYAITRRRRSFRKGTTLVLAALMLLGMTNCKKKVAEPIAPTGGNKVAITLNVDGGAKAVVTPPSVAFETGDKILVASNGHYVGTLTATRDGDNVTFSGDITDPVVGEPLYFYFLGNKATGTLTPGTSGSTSCTVDIIDQTNYPHLPVISMGVSIDRSNHNAIVEYTSGVTSYEAQLHNKASLMKFNVDTDSKAAICLKGLNNKVTVNFEHNTFAYDQVNDGLVKMSAINDLGETWAIVLPQDAWNAGGEGTAYTDDGIYTGARPKIDDNIAENQYLDGGVDVVLTTYTEKGMPLTFEAKTAGAMMAAPDGANTFQYKINNGAWTDYDFDTNPIIELPNVGDKVRFRGTNNGIYPQASQYPAFQFVEEWYVYGNIMSILYEDTYVTATDIQYDYAFTSLFADVGMTIHEVPNIYSHPDNPLLLPATTLTEGCYYYMFAGCTNLTTAPELPATTLALGCYMDMFAGCTSLVTAPELPAATLTDYCYYEMFADCSNLNSVTCLATTDFDAEYCLYGWLSNVAAAGTLNVAGGTKSDWETTGTVPSGWTIVDPAAPTTVTWNDSFISTIYIIGGENVSHDGITATFVGDGIFCDDPDNGNKINVYDANGLSFACGASYNITKIEISHSGFSMIEDANWSDDGSSKVTWQSTPAQSVILKGWSMIEGITQIVFTLEAN